MSLHARLTQLFNAVPRRVSLSVAGLFLAGFVVLSFTQPKATEQPAPDEFNTHEISIPQQLPEAAADEPVPDQTTAETVITDPEPVRHTLKVKPGQTLAQVFATLSLGATVVHNVVNVDKNTKRLAKIYPGDELNFTLSPEGEFQSLEYQLEEDALLRVIRDDEGYQSELVSTELAPRIRHASGTIQDSLFLAGSRAGMSDALIMELAGLFGWDIDFVLDIRSGDEFHVIYEELYRDGELIRTGDILAATFVNQGKGYQAVGFETENGFEYFAPDGRNMKKAFLRAPLNFSYISSNFNPKRFHPILRRVKAHNGIDYRAPSGTPVYAAGNGTVIASAKNRFNGNYVFIQHGNNIVTKYLHFTKRTVKKGQRVKQGQTIGYVGMTGLAEAPHLHYEFVVNGVHRNPRTVDLPKAEALPKVQLAEFEQYARPFLHQLDRLQQTAGLVALND